MYNDFDLNNLRACLPQYVESITRRNTKSGRDMYNCPLCNSGQGAHGTGAFRLYRDTNSWFCFSCQDKGGENHGGDIFDLIRQYEGIADFNGQVQRAAEFAGIRVDHEKTDTAAGHSKPQERPQRPQEAAKSPQRGNNRADGQKPAERPQDAPQGQNTGKNGASTEKPVDYTEYYVSCSNQIQQAAGYLKRRGISIETAEQYAVGYDAREKRVIIPVTESFYIARAAAGQEPKYKNPAGQGVQLFNPDALYKSDVVFVTEGIFDALSILEAGAAAIALNSASNTELLLDALKKKPTRATLVLSLDNDAGGMAATEKLKTGLQGLDVPFSAINVSGTTHKDPNESITADKDAFIKAVRAAERDAVRPDNIFSYLEAGYNADREQYKQGGKATGFKRWDKLTNGLHKGIYMLAATPGAGKTTLAWQICENLAVAGNDCLYFTLEQSKMDLLTKSIIRRIKLKDMDTGATIQAVKDGTINASREQREIMQEVGTRISVIEGNFSLSANDICIRIENYIRQTGKRPIVFIDYLQALKPLEDKGRRTGNREAIEDTTDLLSGIKNRYDLTMFIISSVSRANYRAALDIDGLKESGRLEYSADAVYTLEFSCIYGKEKELFESDGDINKKKRILADAKAGENGIRYMTLKCVKSRYCNGGEMSEFKYYSGADLFVETNTGELEPIQSSETAFTDEPEQEENPFNRKRR